MTFCQNLGLELFDTNVKDVNNNPKRLKCKIFYKDLKRLNDSISIFISSTKLSNFVGFIGVIVVHKSRHLQN